MANITPRTIVITTIPGKRPMSATINTPMGPNTLLDMDSDSDCYTEGPRKRKRLTHLSPDQRMMRRKLKNRVAAQTARDRKKERMQELEEAVSALETENKRLQNENNKLKLKTGALSQENLVLRDQLGNTIVTSCEGAQSDKDGSLKSAALRSPLPQEKIHLVYQAASQYLAFLLTLSLTSLACSNKSLRVPSQKTLSTMKTSPKVAKLLSSVVRTTHSQWWGPQQQSWNPSKN